jgi:hypothetical protein
MDAMMEPTKEYLSAPELARSRQEVSQGAIQVVVENYSDKELPFGKSVIYISVGNGKPFAELGWKVSLLSRIKLLWREWPVHDISIERIDEHGLEISYSENTYDGPVDHKAKYCFSKKTWII